MDNGKAEKVPYRIVDSNIIAPARLNHVFTVEPRENSLHVYDGTELQWDGAQSYNDQANCPS